MNDSLEMAYLELPKNDAIRTRIDGVIEKLKHRPTFGQSIPKRLIPKEYQMQGVDNAYWVELNKARGWRLIYTLTGEAKVEIVAIILEWFTRHKDYERRFKYG